jgi:hypothetical protein
MIYMDYRTASFFIVSRIQNSDKVCGINRPMILIAEFKLNKDLIRGIFSYVSSMVNATVMTLYKFTFEALMKRLIIGLLRIYLNTII